MSILNKKIWYIWTHLAYKFTFGKIGKRSLIYKPIQIDNAKSIFIENDVYIAQYAWLMGSINRCKSLCINSGTTIGHYSHIIAMNSVTIGEDVLIADKVFISDCSHSFEDINRPVKHQEVKALNPVSIGAGSWIGENVCIFGSSIGKNCVIGANSVVISDIPDYCIAVGSPAKVVKRFDLSSKKWLKC